MSLVPDYDDSDSSSSNSYNSDSEEVSKTEDQPLSKIVLPKPNFDDSNIEVSRNSVFKNPFIEAENAKEAILQKHVKMVNTKDNVVLINGKKICWNYRKGRCRFGHNCKFAHDSDIQKSRSELDADKKTLNTVICQNQSLPQPSPEDLEKIKEESITQNQQKRKRPGLSQGLVPGKKVLKNYMKFK